MKLQLSDQHWRVRISEDELTGLREGQALISTSSLPGDAALCFAVKLVAADHATVDDHEGRWNIALPASLVEAYVQRLPCREGVTFSVPVSADTVLEIVFEVDVRDSVRRRGVTARRRT